jgi:hypothetical protein
MSIRDQFLQYAEEAILTASYDRSGKAPSDDSPKSTGDLQWRAKNSSKRSQSEESRTRVRNSTRQVRVFP